MDQEEGWNLGYIGTYSSEHTIDGTNCYLKKGAKFLYLGEDDYTIVPKENEAVVDEAEYCVYKCATDRFWRKYVTLTGKPMIHWNLHNKTGRYKKNVNK